MTTESTRADWRSVLLPADAELRHAIQNLDQTGLQIVMVVGSNDRLLGTLTDGDIRRGLLRGMEMSSRIESIMARDPFVVPPQFGRDAVMQLMQANKIQQLPIVDEHRRVVGLHLFDELMVPGLRDNMMVLMAGGLGTRLRPHTEKCPKPMLPVNGRPMLEHIIERARNEGFHEFVVTLHFLGQLVEEHFGDGRQWNASIRYVHETTPLGTAGGLRLLDPRPTSAFLVSNGDVLTDIRYAELLDFHMRHGAVATMAVRQHQWQHPFGIVHTKGVDIIGFEEKPIARTHINAGIYVLQPEALEALNPGEKCDMPTLFERVRELGGRTIVYPMHEPWLDVGSPEDYTSAQSQIAKMSPDAQEAVGRL